jgi:hypothetical protein
MDFGAQAACVEVMLHREVDRTEAEGMGFAADAYERLIEQPLDVEMQWVPKESEAGGAASGYEASTRLRIVLEVDGFEYVELDPERCDSTRCTLDDGTTTTPEGCEPFLFVRAHGALETADGAIQATFAPQNVRLIRADAEADYGVALAADLSEVRGTLQLDPAVPEPYVGVIYLSLQYTPAEDLEFAIVSVNVFADWDARGEDTGSLPSELSHYRPLEGVARTPR